jgi:N-acyl amino acid synthase of PEP-CTERM/exosortase system
MLVEILSRGGTTDLLIPYFRFQRLVSERHEVDLFAEIAKLRFEVYCDECKFLDKTDYENGEETDHFDERAIHIAAQNLQGGVVGTIRLVLASTRQAFPFEEHCSIHPEFSFPPREESGEISRLIVKKSYRRRAGDSLQGVTKEFQETGSAKTIAPTKILSGKNRRSNSPLIMLGMYREMYRYSRQTGIRYWYAAMEKSLARLLDRMGFHFVPVGPETDYYGPVTTYMVDLRELEATLLKANRFLSAWFRDEPISDWLFIAAVIKRTFTEMGQGRKSFARRSR